MTRSTDATDGRATQTARRTPAKRPTATEVDAAKGTDSRYGYLKATYGEAYADLWMREREVASWDMVTR